MARNGWIQTSPGGVALPSPIIGSSGITISTLVSGGSNALGTFIGQTIGDNKLAYDLAFQYLTPIQLQAFLRLFDPKYGGSFLQPFSVFDPALGDFRTAQMYVSDRRQRPLHVNANFMPEMWLDISATLKEA